MVVSKQKLGKLTYNSKWSEFNIQLFITLLLVQHDARPACLFLLTEQHLIEIKSWSKGLNINRRKTKNPTKDYYLFYKDTLPLQRSDETDNQWMGRILGYDEPGPPNTESERYGVKYEAYVNGKYVAFHDEVCVSTNNIVCKVQQFNNVTARIGIEVTMRVIPMYSRSLLKSMYAEQNVNWFKAHPTAIKYGMKDSHYKQLRITMWDKLVK